MEHAGDDGCAERDAACSYHPHVMISVVICSVRPERFERVSAHYADLLRGGPFEIVGVHDAKGLCEGYNRGADRATGDILFFSHDDIEFLSKDLRAKSLSRLTGGGFDLIGVAGTTRISDALWASAGPPYVCGQVAHPSRTGRGYDIGQWNTAARVFRGVQAVDGLWFAATRRLWEASPFDEATFTGFHMYDVDFSFCAHRAGFRVGVCADIAVIHDSEGRFGAEWRREADKFEAKHAGALLRTPRREFDVGGATVTSRTEALELMTPPHWSAATAGHGG